MGDNEDSVSISSSWVKIDKKDIKDVTHFKSHNNTNKNNNDNNKDNGIVDDNASLSSSWVKVDKENFNNKNSNHKMDNNDEVNSILSNQLAPEIMHDNNSSTSKLVEERNERLNR